MPILLVGTKMIKQIKQLKRLFKKDDGYSLLEIGIATGIMVIGFSVAAPALNTALNDASANETKTNLYQASLIVEDSRYQNEGAYPTTVPTEIISNPLMLDFRYTYNDDQTIYCLMGRDDTGQKWFMTNTETEPYMPTPDKPGCTQDNLGSGSKALGEAPVLIPPTVTGSNLWDFGDYDATMGSMNWTAAGCTPSTTDPNPGAVQKIEYQARIVNTDSGEIVQAMNGDWMVGTSVNRISLDGWLPSDEISYQVRQRCTYDYETYYDSWAATADTVDEFPVKGSLVKKSPEPTMTWTYAQEFPVISYEGTEITCPIIASPRYRAVVTQGAKTIEFGWMTAPVYSSLSLTNFVARQNIFIASQSACKINNNYYLANSPADAVSNTYDGDIIGGGGGNSGDGAIGAGPFLPPDPPPAGIMGLHCVTKYERLDESTKGDCQYDATIADSTYVPNAVSWGSPGCIDGYNIEFFVRRSAPNTTEWQNVGSSTTYNIGTNTVNPGALVTYEVKGRCVHATSGTPSDYSQVSSVSFRTSWKPSDASQINFIWTPSTSDTSWTSSSQEGSGYLYDRMTGAATSTCQNGTVPSSYRFNVSTDGGTTWFTSSPSASSYVNRSELSTQADTFWPMGLSIKVRGQAICSDPLGDYAAIPSAYSEWSGTTELGYSAPVTVTGLNCVTKHQRVTEATRGNCEYNPAVAEQTYTPDLIKWNAPVCVAGYSPEYYIRSVMGATTGNWTNTSGATTWVPATSNGTYAPNTAAQYDVKYICRNATNGKYSADSFVASKTYTLSHKPITTSTIAFNWTPSTADSSWSTTSALNGYYLYDRFTGAATSTCSNGTAPTSYNLQIDRNGKNTPTSINSKATSVINRSEVASADSYWPQGTGLIMRGQAVCSDPYGDYNAVTQSWSPWSAVTYIAVSAPSAPASPTNNGWGTFSWGTSNCAYADGGSAEYASRQGRYGNEYGYWGANGWGTSRSSGVPRYTEGYPFDMYAKARCVSSYGIYSPESTESVSSWTAYLNHYGTWHDSYARHFMTRGSCPGGSWEAGHGLFAHSGAGLYHGWYWGWGWFFGQYYGGGNDGSAFFANGNWGSSYAVSGYTYCTTSWRATGNVHGWTGTDGGRVVY